MAAEEEGREGARVGNGMGGGERGVAVSWDRLGGRGGRWNIVEMSTAVQGLIGGK